MTKASPRSMTPLCEDPRVVGSIKLGGGRVGAGPAAGLGVQWGQSFSLEMVVGMVAEEPERASCT